MHFLEGDGPLALRSYEAMNIIFTAICSAHYLNVQAVAKKLEGNVHNVCLPQMLHYTHGSVKSGLDYFLEKLELKEALSAFQLIYPPKVHIMQPTSSDIECLHPFMTNEHVQLKELQ